MSVPAAWFVRGLGEWTESARWRLGNPQGPATRLGFLNAITAQIEQVDLTERASRGTLATERNHQRTDEGRSVRRQQNEISFHCLRHTATSLMKNAGVSLGIVQEFIGHDSPAISANYTHIEMDAMRRAGDCLPDIGPNRAEDVKA